MLSHQMEGRVTMASTRCLYYVLLVTSLHITMVTPSGYMLTPHSRPSGWRFGEGGFPIDRNDENLNCGGAHNQWEVHGGKCGVCGDPYQGPREHEAGGKYATGKTTATLTAGSTLPVTIELTGNKLGWFEFRICPHNNITFPVSQDCLDHHVLKVVNSDSTKIKVPSGKLYFNDIGLQLPYDISCEQCFLQWKYQTGDVKDDCSDCWGKEQFYSCADISIIPGPSTKPLPTTTPTTTTPTTTTPTTTTPTTTPTTTTPTTTTPTTTTPTTTTPTTTTPTTTTPTTTTPTTTTPTTTTPTTTILTTTPSDYQNCSAHPDWKHVPSMDQWCKDNCARGYCPPQYCVCDGHTLPPGWEVCGANSDWANNTDMDAWCRVNCRQSQCPPDKCTCPSWSTTLQSSTMTPPTTDKPRPPPVTSPDRVCRPRYPLARIPGMMRWCREHCQASTICPTRVCKCTEERTLITTKSQSVTMQISTKGTPTSTKTTPPLQKTTPPVARTTPPVSRAPPSMRSCGQACCAVGVWSRVAGMHSWCQNNCRRGSCPPTHCKCARESRGDPLDEEFRRIEE